MKRPLTRLFRPRVEMLESRCLLATGIFDEDFSSDTNPTQPGLDSASDGFQIAHQLQFGFLDFFDVSRIPPGPNGDFFSPPHGLFLNAIDRITFPDMLADEFINLARVNVSVGARGSHVRFIARDGRSLTIPLQFAAPVVGIIATSQTPADDGQPLGQILELEIFGIETIVDDIRVLVTRNFAPEPQPDLATASPREVISIPVLANDVSSNFDPLTITAVTPPPHGQVEIDGENILYVSNQGFTGVDTFEYTVQDTFGATATASVTVQVLGPVAVNDRTVTLPGIPVEIDVLENDTTPGDDDLLTIVALSDPAGGTAEIVSGRVVYTPDAGFRGSDTFTYTLRDPFRNEATGTVTVIVNTSPAAADLVFTLAHNTLGPFTLATPGLLAGASDPDGLAPAIVPATHPLSFGSVSIAADGSFTITSDRGDGRILDATFPYRVRDEFGFEAVGQVRIEVENALPIVLDPSHTELRFSAATLVGTLGTDADGDPLLVELVDPPLHGTVTFYPLGPDATGRTSVRYEYVPTGGLRLNDRFTFRLHDGYGASEPGTFELATNNAGMIAVDDSIRVQHSVQRGLRILQNDTGLDSDSPYILLGQQPSHGTAWVSDDGTALFYRSHPIFVGPDEVTHYVGPDTLTYRLTDGDFVSNEATVQLNVVAPPDIALPELGDDVYVLAYGRPEVGNIIREIMNPDVRSNDFIPADDAVSSYRLKIVSSPVIEGLYVDTIGGNVVVEYRSGFTGSFTIGYGVFVDEQHVGNTASLTVRIVDRDTDGDGVLDSVEDRLDDRNYSGFAADTALRAVVPDAVNGRPIELQSERGIVLRNVEAIYDPAHGAVPLPASLPLGAFAFELHNVPPGGATTVSLRLPEGINVNTYYKFGTELIDNPATPLDERAADHWYEFAFDGTTGARWEEDEVGIDQLVLHLVDNGRGDSDPRLGIIRDPGAPAFVESTVPRVQNVTINDGETQRSMITSLSVEFDRAVSILRGAFDLRQIGARKAVDLQISLREEGGRTIALLTFRGPGVQHASLKDGDYRLTIRGDKIAGADGDLLDGDGDGLAGGNRVDEFFRRFGDTDGDDDVDRLDAKLFASTFGKRQRDAGYLWYLDFNANGKVWKEDLAQFLAALCRSSKRH